VTLKYFIKYFELWSYSAVRSADRCRRYSAVRGRQPSSAPIKFVPRRRLPDEDLSCNSLASDIEFETKSCAVFPGLSSDTSRVEAYDTLRSKSCCFDPVEGINGVRLSEQPKSFPAVEASKH
jgi:hypothetical protein